MRQAFSRILRKPRIGALYAAAGLAAMSVAACATQRQGAAVAHAQGEGAVTVRDLAGLRRALSEARPGTRILLAAGVYTSGFLARDVRGAEGKPVVIAAADPKDPPVFRGGSGVQLSDVAHLELRDLVFEGATGNGLNIDDGGSFDTPAHHLALVGLTVRDVGPQGNRDGIKLSGVDDFRVEGCVVERWGNGGSGIDMVGCHRGVIERCRFVHGDSMGSNAVQAKGGTRDVAIRRCHFQNAGQRAVNLGGSTGLEFFRPRPEGFEARDVTVEGCVFVGSIAPVAFVGVDGATVRFNTIYRPKRWALRILQETTAPGFVPCRNGRFTDNLILFRSDEMAQAVNIGPNTAPQTFRFARNWWYCLDQPSRSRPSLPAPETEAVVGRNPRLRDPERGDFGPTQASPATAAGAHAYREP
jgi:hypothetical protein